MTTHAVLMCLVAGVLFGSYPFLVRPSGFNWIPAGLLFHIGSIAVFVILAALDPAARRADVSAAGLLLQPEFATKMRNSIPMAILMGMGMVVIAGLMNGIGHASFQFLIASKVELSRVANIVPTLCVIVGLVLGTAIGKEPVTMSKVIATALALGSIWFASR